MKQRIKKYLVAAFVAIAAHCFAKDAAAESRKFMDLPADKCPAYSKAVTTWIAMAIADFSCDSAQELEVHEEIMKYANNPRCYSEGWYNEDTQKFWRDYDAEKRQLIKKDSEKSCNKTKQDEGSRSSTTSVAPDQRADIGSPKEKMHLGLWVGEDPKQFKGLGVYKVQENSPASLAGIIRGDIITQVNGENIESSARLDQIIGALSEGSKLRITVIRNGSVVPLDLIFASTAPRTELHTFSLKDDASGISETFRFDIPTGYEEIVHSFERKFRNDKEKRIDISFSLLDDKFESFMRGVINTDEHKPDKKIGFFTKEIGYIISNNYNGQQYRMFTKSCGGVCILEVDVFGDAPQVFESLKASLIQGNFH